MKKYFGTDGIRGIPNKTLTSDIVSKIATAVEEILKPKSVAVILDTRETSFEILDWICEGFSEDTEVVNYGILPSGSMPILLKEFNHELGVIISASHNPSEYNGIKLIDKYGSKLNDNLELEIENLVPQVTLPVVRSVFKNSDNGYEVYLQSLNDFLNFDLSNFDFVVDTANGSASKVMEDLFTTKGAKYKLISNSPDGNNINQNCGATYTQNLLDNLKSGQLGVAFDGDADRLIMIDEMGNVCNGDILILLIAKYLAATNQLNNNIVISTVMSNFGFKNAMKKNNFKNIETDVGDKYVAEAMAENNASLGGEQSGHIIISELLPVGDGLLTMIFCLKALSFFNISLHEFRVDNITEYPQKLINLELETKLNLEQLEELNILASNLVQVENLDGRFLIRNSGTEPILRVLIEAKDIDILENYSEKLIHKIKKHLQK